MEVRAGRAQSVDIDRIARQARIDKASEDVDLVRDGVPLKVAHWNILVEPVKPKTMSDGGIMLPEDMLKAEAIQTTLGRVLQCGPTAFEGKTSSGISLATLAEGISSAEQLIGRYVIYQKYTGHAIQLRRTGTKLILLTVTEILAVPDNPADWQFYL